MLTRKDLYNYGARVYYVGYCDAEALLRGHDRIGANGGVYGWNWSAYRPAHDIIINTGYRNMTGTDARKVTRTYEEQAKEVYNNWDLLPAEREKQLEQIRAAWLNALRAM